MPDYYEVIESPMDLQSIRNKVHSYKYEAPNQLLDDVRLIFNNCVEYNARNTPEYKAGQNLTKFFNARVKELGLSDDPSSPTSSKKAKRWTF